MHTNIRSNKSVRRGFTLTEIAIVLGIIGTVLGAIWVAAAHAHNNQKTTRAANQILTIASGVAALYPNGQIPGNPQWTITALAINSGIFPADMITSSCSGSVWGSNYSGGTGLCALDPWGTEILIGSQTAWNGFPSASNRFEVITTGMTNAQCAALISSVLQGASAGSLVEVYADGVGLETVTTSTSPTAFANCSGNVGFQFQL